jgi:hypothetical protein
MKVIQLQQKEPVNFAARISKLQAFLVAKKLTVCLFIKNAENPAQKKPNHAENCVKKISHHVSKPVYLPLK